MTYDGAWRLPESWIDANWRNVTAVAAAEGRIGIGFDVPGQPTIRLAVSVKHAQAIADCINFAIGDYKRQLAASQLPMSALMSSEPVSVPSDSVGQ